MTVEQITLAVSIVVLVMQGVSLYTSAKLKVWCMERFVSKTDFLDTLNMWSRHDPQSNRSHV